MNDLLPLLEVLYPEQQASLSLLANELADTWGKSQVFRTETEALVSVLNDGKHPTNASKYWQCVREQSVMLNELVALSFDIRRNDVARKRIEAKLRTATDFDREELQIDLAENGWKAANMRRIASDRVREILMWSDIKKSLDDGTFDTTDPNTHQPESLPIVFERRVATLGPSPGAADCFNAVSLLETARRLQNIGVFPVPMSENVRSQREAIAG